MTVGRRTPAPVGPCDRPRVLIIVQNLPVPFDRRVWLECQTLVGAGYRVAVVCPKGPSDPAYQEIDGIELFKYRAYTSNGGKLSFAIEYAYSFLATLCLVVRASRSGRFSVIQSCNPPDIFWPIGLLFRALQGSRFVFDHHDLSPETFKVRFPSGPRIVYSLLLFLERQTVRSADHVVATNDSYRKIALERHGLDPERVTVVRTGPDPQRLYPRQHGPMTAAGDRHVVAYIGVMGPQDGVEIVLEVADIVVHQMKRADIGFVLMGSGDCFEELVATRDRLGLAEFVDLTGRVPDDVVARTLSSADVGISPDPQNGLNELCTMNKTMEYMAFGLPVVAFDLVETRVSAGESAVYAAPNDVEELARLLVGLIDDEPRRRSMGALGRSRVESQLAWDFQAPRYLGIFDQLVGQLPAIPRTEVGAEV